MSIEYTDDELTAEIRRVADKLGKIPSEKDMAEHGEFGRHVYARRFGTFTKARAAAGLPSLGGSPEVTREELIEDIQHAADELGRPPFSFDIEFFSDHARSTYSKRFDSWADALSAAGFEENDRFVGPSLTADWERLREQVLERDEHECQHCGMTAEESVDEHGMDLHVHHEIPRGEYTEVDGINDPSNLTTLCVSCHGETSGSD